jgi:hypothetical protein
MQPLQFGLICLGRLKPNMFKSIPVQQIQEKDRQEVTERNLLPRIRGGEIPTTEGGIVTLKT